MRNNLWSNSREKGDSTTASCNFFFIYLITIISTNFGKNIYFSFIFGPFNLIVSFKQILKIRFNLHFMFYRRDLYALYAFHLHI